MRLPVWFFGVSVWLLTVGGGLACAQSGTLQMPSRPHHDQPVRPPAAAPRTAVRELGSGHAIRTPVVPPHGLAHPVKPGPADSVISVLPPPPAPLPPVAKPPAAVGSGAQPAAAEALPDPEKPAGAPSKLPRFASLRSDDVNMRAGPGTRYRIDWVYKRRELPVEIEREFDVWRWVRDADGIQGWVHQATLMGRRTFIVRKADATLRSDPSDSASAVAILKPGVIGRIRSCEASSDWCDLQTGSYRGYLRRSQFWGVLPGEAVKP